MQRRRFLQAGAAGVLASPFLAVWARQDSPDGGVIRLNSNENALGLSRKVREAVMAALSEANRYPLSLERPLREALARKQGLSGENIVLGNGSSEVLQMAVQALSRKGCRVLVADPTFESTEFYASTIGLEVLKIPLLEDYAHDLARMRQLAEDSSGGALVYLCNPNNPTGTLTSCRQIDEWVGSAGEQVVFLMDEAYFDYVGSGEYWSMRKWVEDRPNVVVLRTFSKVYGLAGLRIGYGMAHPETVKRMRDFASDININHVALVAAGVALRDDQHVRRSLRVNDEGKRILLECCRELEIGVIPSQTNFVMHEVRGNLDDYNRRMEEASIRVGRPFPPFLSHSRVSIGLVEEMNRFADRLHAFRKRGWI